MSTSKSIKKKKKTIDKKQNGTNSVNVKISDLQLQLDQTNQKYLRILAEFDNYKKRISTDIQEQKKYSGSSIIRSLLSVFDDIHRILKHKDISDLNKVIEGIELINNNVMKILESNDIASFDSIGNIFDHNIHEAIAQKSSKEKKGIIIDEFEKGYTYHDRVIRHAKVIVSSGKE